MLIVSHFSRKINLQPHRKNRRSAERNQVSLPMKDLTTGSLPKNFLLFAIPLILSGLLSQAYHTIDTVIAGRFLGQTGLAAIGATSQAISLLSAFFWGFAAGFGVYVAKLFGAGEYSRIKNDVCNVFLFQILILAALSLLCVFFKEWILSLLNVAPEIRREAGIYFAVYISGFGAIILNNSFTYVLNALGSSSYPFFLSLVSAFLNIGGNILSVTVLKLGVAGIAGASVFAGLTVDLLFIIKLRQCYRQLGIEKEKFFFSHEAFRHSLRYALPPSVQQIALYLSSFAMSPIINGIGSSASASYTVIMRVYDLNAGIYQNSSRTLSNYVAQCIGAEKFHKIRQGLFFGLLQGILFTLPCILLCAFWAEPINAIFFPDGYAGDALAYAVRFSRVYLPFLLLNLINNLFHSFFRGIAAMRLLLISTVLGSAVRLGTGFLFSAHLGLDGIFIGWVISWFAEALFMLFLYWFRFRNAELLRQNIH